MDIIMPSVNFELNLSNLYKIECEFIGTRFGNRRIRVSSVMFGKTIYLNQDQVLNVEFTDKTSFVPDTLPSRTFSFNLNNYDGTYNVDNPENGYLSLDKQTRVQFRIGYNVAGYEYNEDGTVKFDSITNLPIVNNEEGLEEIEWDDWKELRLINVSANADESVTFEDDRNDDDTDADADDDDEEEESDRGWFERLGDKVKQTVQKNIDDWLGNGSSTATDDDDDADDWGSAPVVKDDKQKEREKLSGMDQNFMVGRWSVKMMSAGNQYSNQPIPKGIIPNITVVFKPNGRWSGHVDAITIANSVTIPGQDTSGTYTFDGFNLKYGTGEVFVVTKISENEIATRDINSGATARMTRAD